ncbi:MAG TPA: hypothetical protein VFF81_08030 [Noviherbaspirillum sp.]|nr:hypothetical protein [Noviherbaspirillum sp.]
MGEKVASWRDRNRIDAVVASEVGEMIFLPMIPPTSLPVCGECTLSPLAKANVQEKCEEHEERETGKEREIREKNRKARNGGR